MQLLFVIYPGDAAERFDRDYYVSKHLPLVREAWGPHGLLSAAAFFPVGSGEGTIAVAVCVFADEPALERCLAAEQTASVMADVKSFTDAKPTQSRGVPVR